MSNSCAKCGAPLSQGQTFCTKCGTHRSELVAAQPPAQFCTACGTSLPFGSSFCTECGTRVAPAAPGFVPQAVQFSPAATQASAAGSAPQLVAPPAAKQPRSFAFKLVVAIVVLLVVGSMALAVGIAYVGHVAKKRIPIVEQAYKKDDLGGMVAAATGQENKPQPLPTWKAASAELVSSPSSKVPLIESLRLVSVGNDVLRGDYESVFDVDKVTNELVHISASQQFPSDQGIEKWLNNGTNNDKPRKIECGRIVFTADMQDSAEVDGYFCREGRQEQHRGTTAMGLSKKTLNALKTTGTSEFTYHEDPLKSLFKSFKNAMASDPKNADAASQELMNKMMSFAPGTSMGNNPALDTPPLKAALRRNGDTDVAFPVMVNDQPTELPVIDVVIKLEDGKEGHAYVLDDLDNPLMLAAASTGNERQQVIKIYWNQKQSDADKLADELEKNHRARIYDIYFDFRSDNLRPESGRVLTEIAEVMRKHPDWKLTIEGNTDNVGGDAYNLDLSKRRAANVKSSLVGKYLVSADRLITNGFGASHPIDTNETIEGRARNRRVELALQ